MCKALFQKFKAQLNQLKNVLKQKSSIEPKITFRSGSKEISDPELDKYRKNRKARNKRAYHSRKINRQKRKLSRGTI